MDLSAYCAPTSDQPNPSSEKRSFLNAKYAEEEPDTAEAAEPKAELKRKCIDYHSPAIIDVSSRLYRKSNRRSHAGPGGSGAASPYLQCHSNYLRWMGLPLGDMAGNMPCSTAFLTYCAHVTRAKNSNPVMWVLFRSTKWCWLIYLMDMLLNNVIWTHFLINKTRCLSWTPGGRRLLTGNQEGEFTLWDGVNFSFELIMSAHDQSFRCMAWSHNQNYLLTSDSGGNIKYWSPSIAPVQSIDSHDGQPIHALSFSPADTKFVSCGDDATVCTIDQTIGWWNIPCIWHHTFKCASSFLG